MLLAYVDESYDSHKYWIVALVVPDHAIAPLTAALDVVVRDAAFGYGVGFESELHGHDLFHGKGDWEPLALAPRARIGVYADAFDAIATHPVDVIIEGVDIDRLVARYPSPDPPHRVVLTHLLERIHDRSQWSHGAAPVLVIADEIDNAAAYRRNLWYFQRYATPGYRARKLGNIVDTIHFAPSSASRLVQAADLIAFLCRRMAAREGLNTRADRANEALWDRINHRVCHRRCWYP